MSVEMDRLEASVRSNTTVVDSAILFIQGIAAQVRDAAGDRAKSLTLADELDAKAGQLGQAILDNTPPAGTRKP